MNLKGIKLKRGKWVASVWGGQDSVHLGTFNTLGEALGARDAGLNLLNSDDIRRYNKNTVNPEVQKLIDVHGVEVLWATPISELKEAPTPTQDPFKTLGIQIGETPVELKEIDEEDIAMVRRVNNIQPFNGDTSSVLIFSDLHAPYNHPDAVPFLKAVAEAFQSTLIVNLGDEIDSNSIAFFPYNPDLPNASMELKCARKVLSQVQEAVVGNRSILSCHSNHTSRPYKKAKQQGVPKDILLPYEKMLGVNWNWAKDWIITLPNGTEMLLTHTKGWDTLKAGQTIGANIASGHYHRSGGVEWWRNIKGMQMFAVKTPCLIDHDSEAYSYDETAMVLPNLGCVVIVDSQPFVVLMNLDDNKRWDGKILGG